MATQKLLLQSLIGFTGEIDNHYPNKRWFLCHLCYGGHSSPPRSLQRILSQTVPDYQDSLSNYTTTHYPFCLSMSPSSYREEPLPSPSSMSGLTVLCQVRHLRETPLSIWQPLQEQSQPQSTTGPVPFMHTYKHKGTTHSFPPHPACSIETCSFLHSLLLPQLYKLQALTPLPTLRSQIQCLLANWCHLHSPKKGHYCWHILAFHMGESPMGESSNRVTICSPPL